MSAKEADLVIWGMTLAGRPFRPSDWAERLAGLVSVFGDDQRLAYSPYVRPVTVAGVRAVVVGGALAALEPRLYAFMAGFARDNDLQHGGNRRRDGRTPRTVAAARKHSRRAARAGLTRQRPSGGTKNKGAPRERLSPALESFRVRPSP